MASINAFGDRDTAVQPSQVKPAGNRPRVSPWTLTCVDAGIAGSLIVVPFFMGGRTPVGQLVFAGVAFWTCLWWAIHQTLDNGDRAWRSTLAFWPLAMALGLGLLQLVPLSASLLETLSPHLYQVLPLWKADVPGQTSLGTWQTLSFTPEATRQSLTLLLSGILLFVVTVQRVKHISDVERIIRWMAISVSLMAAFGIIQFLTSNGKFFWFFEHPYSRTDTCVKGAFTNRNHFAQFIALGFGAVLWWVYGNQTPRQRRSSSRNRFGADAPNASLKNALKALLVPICALAVLMSFSRGGVLALLVSCIAALFLLRKVGKLSRPAFAVLTGSGLVVCLGLSIHGYDVLSNRFQGANTLASFGERSRLWAAAAEGFGDHLICGTGLASHRFVYPIYLKPEAGDDTGTYYTHAENGYVQIAMETGAAGIVLALTAMGFYCFWCVATLAKVNHQREALCFVALLPPLLANAVHSTMDYIWYVPGCMGAVAILAACACRLYQLQRQQTAIASPPRPLPRCVWAGIAVVLMVASGFSLPGLCQAFLADTHWNRYLALERSLEQLNRDTAYEDIRAESESRRQILLAILGELSNTLEARPDWAFAHARKAEVHLDLFHEFQSTAMNEFDLRQIRDAVFDNFDSLKAAREWLPRGVGEHFVHLDAALKHAHQAVRLGPLQGEIYLILAQLAFLESDPVPLKSAYVHQAFKVRPHDGSVLFEIGAEMALAGRSDLTLEYWKRSFRRGGDHQKRLIQRLAGLRPAEEFLREFQPDANALEFMLTHYTRVGLVDELDAILAAHAAACESKAESFEHKEAAKYWARAARSHGRLHNASRRQACLKRAVAADVTNFDNRLAFGQACAAIENFTEAEKHFRWCVQRKPGHPTAERLLEQAVEKRIIFANRFQPMQEARLPFPGPRR